MSDQRLPSLNDLEKLLKDIDGLFELIDPLSASYSLLITYRADTYKAINPRNDNERATRSKYDKWGRFVTAVRQNARPSEVKSRQPEPEPEPEPEPSQAYEPQNIISSDEAKAMIPIRAKSSSSADATNPAVPETQVEDQVSQSSARPPQSHNRNASTSTFGTPKDPSKEYYSMTGSTRKHNPQGLTSFQRSNEAADEHTYQHITQESGRNTATQRQGTMPPSASSHVAPGKVQRSASSETPQSGKGGAQHITSQHQTFPPNNPPSHIKRSASSGTPQSVQGFGEYTTSHHTNSGNLSHNARTSVQPPTGHPQAMPRSHSSHTTAHPSSFHQAQVHGAPQSHGGYSSGPAPQAHGYMPGQHQAMSGSHMNVPSSNYASYGDAMVRQNSQGGNVPPAYQQQYAQQASASVMPTGSSSSNSGSGPRFNCPPGIGPINGAYFDDFGREVYRDDHDVWRYVFGRQRWVPK